MVLQRQRLSVVNIENIYKWKKSRRLQSSDPIQSNPIQSMDGSNPCPTLCKSDTRRTVHDTLSRSKGQGYKVARRSRTKHRIYPIVTR